MSSKKSFYLNWAPTKNNTPVKITLQHWSALIDDLRLIYNCSSKLFIWRHNYTYNCLSVHFIPFFLRFLRHFSKNVGSTINLCEKCPLIITLPVTLQPSMMYFFFAHEKNATSKKFQKIHKHKKRLTRFLFFRVASMIVWQMKVYPLSRALA